MKKALPSELTSYDFLKAAALVLMIVDHVGVYFFPDDLWWRAVGRLSAPVWLFLIGYAQSRDLSPRLWIGAGVLVAASLLVSKNFFPVNILVTIILIRLVIDNIMEWALKVPHNLWRVAAFAVFLVVPSSIVFDYGTLAFVIAACGVLARRATVPGDPAQGAVKPFMVFAAVFYVAIAQITLGFPSVLLGAMTGGIASVFWILSRFSPQVYPRLSAALPGFLTGLIQGFGRRTLEIYVIHLLIFKALACYLGVEGYGLFEGTWF